MSEERTNYAFLGRDEGLLPGAQMLPGANVEKSAVAYHLAEVLARLENPKEGS